MNGTASCIENQCTDGCNTGLVCCMGMCLNDPCAGFNCPIDTVCKMDNACHPTCQSINKDVVSAQGGGGWSCTLSGHGGPQPLGAVLLLMLAILVSRRKRS
jgi:MYXO-CTERM domain-containing protein